MLVLVRVLGCTFGLVGGKCGAVALVYGPYGATWWGLLASVVPVLKLKGHTYHLNIEYATMEGEHMRIACLVPNTSLPKLVVLSCHPHTIY
jgi:hypothetical protein